MIVRTPTRSASGHFIALSSGETTAIVKTTPPSHTPASTTCATCKIVPNFSHLLAITDSVILMPGRTLRGDFALISTILTDYLGPDREPALTVPARSGSRLASFA